MIEQSLSMLGLAKKAGRVEIGEEPVGAAARAKKARVILVAQDAGASSQRRAFSFAEQGACLCLTVPADKDALGRALGRTSVAMCAVTEIGFAGAVVKKLAALDPARYEAAAQQLDVKAQRAMERRAEQLRHEKNLRRGKHREHAAQPPAPPAPPEKKPENRRETAAARPVRGAGSDGAKRYSERRGTGKRSAGGRSGARGRPVRSADRFAGSLPVKRGKGSRKKSGQQ